MRDAIDQYYADKNKYPSALQDLVSDGYLREIPKDPITDSADTWQTVPAEPDPNNPVGRARRLQRQERRAGDGDGRNQLFRVGLAVRSVVS